MTRTPNLQRLPEVEVENDGHDAATYHESLKDIGGFCGVTISHGRVYLTFTQDTDLQAAMTSAASALTPVIEEPPIEVLEP